MAIFDSVASDYDAWYTDKKGNFVDTVETDLAFSMIDVERGMNVLDIGCGTGNFSIKLAKMGCNVTGIDISDNMLDIARKKAAEENLPIKFLHMDLNDLKFKENEFDAVFSMAAFEFVDDKDAPKALQGMLRVVKEGGQVLIGTISSNSSWGKLYQDENFNKDTVFKYAKFKTLDDMKNWNKEKLAASGQCLFISPLSPEEDYNYEKENELAEKTVGGYICALWKK
nr:class I SAM-dependent methyltransferase [Sedimentibacter sp.]